MNDLFKFLFFVIAITLNSSLPLPSLPLIVFNYISNDFLFAFFSSIAGSALAACIQYLFVKKVYKLKRLKILNRIKIFTTKKFGKKRNLLKRFAKKVSNISFWDFLLLRLTSIFSFKATNLVCGLIGYPLKKFLIVTTLSQIPCNILYFLVIKSNDLIVSDISELNSSELNIDIFKTPFINFIYSITLIYLISRLITYLIKKYNFIN